VGVEIKVVSEQLGHKTVKITYDTYVHVMPEQKIKEIDKLNAIDKLIA
jgi:integrase